MRARSRLRNPVFASALGGLCLFAAAGCSSGGDGNKAGPGAAYHAPTEAEAKAFGAQLSPYVSRSPVNVRVVNLPHGPTQGHIISGFQNTVIARTNPDGTVSRACVDSEEQASAFLMAATKAPSARTRAEVR